MKNYNETINSVFDRINEYEVEKRRKRKIITRTVTSLFCCLVALLGVGVWQSGLIGTTPPTVLDEEKNNSSISSQQDTNKPNNSVGVTSDATIIWGNASEFQDMGFTEWNGKPLTFSLSDALSNEKNKSSLFAIGVSFELDEKFIYEGKSLAEYSAEVDKEHLLDNRLGELLKVGDELKYGEALYKTGTPDGKKWAKELYDETVERIGKDLLAKYIVNGEFLKDKLESDIVEDNIQKPCKIAYEKALNAFYKSTIDKSIEQLKKQNINYERTNETTLVFFATADELSHISLDNVLFFSLALKAGEGMDMNVTPTDDFVPYW